MTEEKSTTLSTPTLRRLPLYHRFLKSAQERGLTEISATTLANEFNLLPILVRKDLASTGCVGTPKRGFSVAELLEAIEQSLGWNRTNEAFLVGVGSLGRALLAYRGFDAHGIRILAGFDTAPNIVGTEVAGKPIFSMEKLPSLVKRMHVKIGIVTVPAEATQEVCNHLVAAGIRAIWSFSPIHVTLPPNVILHHENLASSLTVLSAALQKKLDEESHHPTKTEY
jgi:redox-sensing transcriptional repressor